jgi:hypothetical protein
MGFAQPPKPLGELGECRAARQVKGQSRILKYSRNSVRLLRAVVHHEIFLS